MSSSALPSATLSHSNSHTLCSPNTPDRTPPSRNVSKHTATTWHLLTPEWQSSNLLTQAQKKLESRANHGLLLICLTVSDNPNQTSYNQPFQKVRWKKKTPNRLFSYCVFKGRKCTLPKKHFPKSCVSTTDLIHHTNSSPQKCNIPIQKQKMYH